MCPNPLSCTTPSCIWLIDKIASCISGHLWPGWGGLGTERTKPRKAGGFGAELSAIECLRQPWPPPIPFIYSWTSDTCNPYYPSLVHWRRYRNTERPASESSCKTKITFQAAGVVSWDDKWGNAVKCPAGSSSLPSTRTNQRWWERRLLRGGEAAELVLTPTDIQDPFTW